jgi:protein gp37
MRFSWWAVFCVGVEMNKTKIEWTDFTSNPIKTKCRHNCWYCYTLRYLKRFPDMYKDEPYWDSLEAGELIHRKKPAKIFVGSMTDVLGDWIPDEMVEGLISICHKAPQHTFQFLTKNPKQYLEFEWPENCWLGATATDHASWNIAAEHLEGLSNIKFISCEPLLGEITTNIACGNFVDWVIVGAMTGINSAYHQPKTKWVYNLIEEAKDYGRRYHEMAKRELRCEIEISFINGPRFHEMTGNELKLYLFLWGQTIEQRKEDLGWMSGSYLARHCNLPAHYIGHYLEKLSNMPGPLLRYTSTPPADSRDTTRYNIAILWSADKHPNFKDLKRSKLFDYKSLNQTKPNQKETKPKVKYSGGKFLGISEADIQKWKETYDLVGIEAEIKKAESWYEANPEKQWTNIKRGLVNWFARSQKQAEDKPKPKRDTRGGENYEDYK